MKSFTYKIPKFVLAKGANNHPVKAYETMVPGLIIHKNLSGEGYMLAHRWSGFSIASRLDRNTLESVARSVALLNVDWMVKKPWELLRQVARLSDLQAKAFQEIVLPPTNPRSGKEWRKIIRSRSTKKGFMAWWKVKRG